MFDIYELVSVLSEAEKPANEKTLLPALVPELASREKLLEAEIVYFLVVLLKAVSYTHLTLPTKA